MRLSHVPAARLPCSSRHTIPTVSCDSSRSKFSRARPASSDCWHLQASNCSRASSVRVSAASIPFDRANVVAPSPASTLCGLRSMTKRAAEKAVMTPLCSERERERVGRTEREVRKRQCSLGGKLKAFHGDIVLVVFACTQLLHVRQFFDRPTTTPGIHTNAASESRSYNNRVEFEKFSRARGSYLKL